MAADEKRTLLLSVIPDSLLVEEIRNRGYFVQREVEDEEFFSEENGEGEVIP